jgi:hypothetical protein
VRLSEQWICAQPELVSKGAPQTIKRTLLTSGATTAVCCWQPLFDCDQQQQQQQQRKSENGKRPDLFVLTDKTNATKLALNSDLDGFPADGGRRLTCVF